MINLPIIKTIKFNPSLIMVLPSIAKFIFYWNFNIMCESSYMPYFLYLELLLLIVHSITTFKHIKINKEKDEEKQIINKDLSSSKIEANQSSNPILIINN